VNDGFLKFPSTPHIAALTGVDIRDDKVLSESERDIFLTHDLVVEEKVDGANLGISFDSEGNIRAQNRGGYLYPPGSGQWKKLWEWLTPRIDILFEHLTDRYILFGEWCYARHSLYYDRLPDWFLCFDLYDRQFGRFLSTTRRDSLIQTMRMAQVPIIAQGRFTFLEITKLPTQSSFTCQPAEGLYLRYDRNDWLIQRAKLVRPAFIQSMESHWTRSGIQPNRLCQNICTHDADDKNIKD